MSMAATEVPAAPVSTGTSARQEREAPAEKRDARPRLRWKRGLAIAGAVAGVTLAGLWVAIHEVPGFGPAVAEGVRSVLGPGAVAWAEDVAYGVQDKVNLTFRGDEPPTSYWQIPAESAGLPATSPDGAAKAADGPAPFEAPFDNVKASGDGTWFPMTEGLWKAQVHPDPKRPFAVVAAVAVDLDKLKLNLVAGTKEPKSYRVPEHERPGTIPKGDWPNVVAAFNGGFRAMHGNYGMRVGEHTFIEPRDIACTIAEDARGQVGIRTWTAWEQPEQLRWYRQTPPCLIENGEPNPGLLHEFNRNWGATVSGETIIRRSAVGIDESGRFLFYGLGDAVTAQSIGRAMQVVGAHNAAQLDVNYAYPRFAMFDTSSDTPVLSEGLIDNMKFYPTDYTVGAFERDFFYISSETDER